MEVTIEYLDALGAREERRIIPIELRFRSEHPHGENQWLLDVWDVKLHARCTLAMKNIREWRL
jgi:hypothetical protein